MKAAPSTEPQPATPLPGVGPRLRGTLGHVLGGTVAGWVGWTGPEPGRIRLLRAGRLDERPALCIVRASVEDGRLTQHFELRGVEGLALAEVLAGQVQVEAAEPQGQVLVLPVWGVLRLAAQIVPLAQPQRLALARWVALLDPGAQPPDLPKPPPAADPVAPAAGFGQVSEDGDVVCGRNGHLFLGEGSNRVQALYGQEPGDLPARWAALFAQRSRRLADRGIRYVQVLLPEKSTALAGFCPFPAEGGSPLLRAVVERAGRVDPAHFRLHVPRFPSEAWQAQAAFQLRDSHLSTEGARQVVEGMLVAMGLADPKPEFEFETRLMQGDLAGRFPGDQREAVRQIRSVRFAGRRSTPELLEQVDPPQGHRGIRRVWRNAHAPFPHRVVAMANSFFERGAASTQLSWWCAHLFTEFHFCWDPEIDEAYLAKVAPDWVIGQTIERFLRQVPAR